MNKENTQKMITPKRDWNPIPKEHSFIAIIGQVLLALWFLMGLASILTGNWSILVLGVLFSLLGLILVLMAMAD